MILLDRGYLPSTDVSQVNPLFLFLCTLFVNIAFLADNFFIIYAALADVLLVLSAVLFVTHYITSVTLVQFILF